jgi:GNAT superfamily N-acetyltransferase
MARSLPERPDLAQLRRQTKELHRAALAGDEGAIARIRAVSPATSLSAAQLAVAREYDFASWPKLKAEVDRRRCIDLGDGAGLARLVARDRSLAREPVRSCLTAPGQSTLTYVGLAGFHGRFDHGHTGELTRVLLTAGAPVDGNPGDAETPLITAASYGELDMARALVEAGADLEATGNAVPGGTALAHAISFGMTDIVDLLVRAGAVVHDISEAAGAGDLTGFLTAVTTQHDKARALHAAAGCERLGVIDQLLAAGTPVDAEVDGATALHVAAGAGKARSVAHLLSRGADPNRHDPNYHSTPLGWCWHHRQGWGPAPGCAEVERLLEPLTDGDWVHEITRAHRAEPGDAGAIAAVFGAALADAESVAVPDAATVARWFGEGPVWIAVRGHDIVGALAVMPERAALRLRGPAVIPLRQRTGTGQMLMTRAGEWAIPGGFDRATVDIPVSRLALRQLYTKFGFAPVAGAAADGADRAAHDRPGPPLVTMMLDLQPLRGSRQAAADTP